MSSRNDRASSKKPAGPDAHAVVIECDNEMTDAAPGDEARVVDLRTIINADYVLEILAEPRTNRRDRKNR